jgi:hypothetical protein
MNRKLMVKLNKIITFLLCKKLGVKKYEKFRFTNQRSTTEYYYFEDEKLCKNTRYGVVSSTVSLNWLLDPDCVVEKVVK